jgi:hypothetical protein
LVVACAESPAEQARGSDPATTTSSSVDRESTFTTVRPEDRTSDDLTHVIDAASADLASRLGVDPSLLEVEVAERMTWPDGRLGCPELDLPYTLEPVEGYRVVLGYEGHLYHFHVGSDATPRLCESLTRWGEGPGTPEPSIPPPIK